MTNLERRLCLAQAAWERWQIERKALEEEIGCSLYELGIEQQDVYGPHTLDTVFAASPDEIRDCVRVWERKQTTTFESIKAEAEANTAAMGFKELLAIQERYEAAMAAAFARKP